MQSLALKSLLETPRAEIMEHPELVRPIAINVLNGALADVDPMDAFDALVAYYTPTAYNRFVATVIITTPNTFTQFYRMEHIVEQLDDNGFFSTQSGRHMLLELVRDSEVPIRDTEKFFGTSMLKTPLFYATMADIDEIARTSFVYDATKKRITGR